MSAIQVLAAVIKRADRYIIRKRPPHKRHGNLWEFPGGKLEPDESLLDAANRELQEELGVAAVKVGEPLVSFADPGSPFVIEFVPTEIRGDPTCVEHSELRWATLHEIQSLPLAPTDRQFVEFALAQRASRQPIRG
ncbi:MAG: NUDIX domain-containing protein [Gemmatimonadaceae bacterium]|nr:NUDIX domain-containing protein [Gemmatimonadaceae bacterium]